MPTRTVDRRPLYPAGDPDISAAVSDQWWAQAACGEVDPELFFVERGRSSAPAKRICAGCPVRLPCLELALSAAGSYADDHGIYGGLTPRERLALRRRPATVGSGHRRGTGGGVGLTPAHRDRAEAARAFGLAERLGVNEAARRLGVSTASLYRAWRHWELGRPDTSRSAARWQRQLRSGASRQHAFRRLERQRRTDVVTSPQRLPAHRRGPSPPTRSPDRSGPRASTGRSISTECRPTRRTLARPRRRSLPRGGGGGARSLPRRSAPPPGSRTMDRPEAQLPADQGRGRRSAAVQPAYQPLLAQP